MRLASLLVTVSFLASPIAAQETQRPTPATKPSTDASGSQTSTDQKKPQEQQSKRETPPLNLPVSLDRIREALAQTPVQPLKGLDETPTFRVEVRERMRIEELLQSLNFKSGPPVPGGLYGYEQQRQLFPSVDNPLVQPYAAFSQGELLTILVENLVGKYLAGKAANAITAAERAHAEAAAKAEVSHAIDEYCAAQPNHGAGIRICTPSPER
jgi:hypothetical protein